MPEWSNAQKSKGYLRLKKCNLNKNAGEISEASFLVLSVKEGSGLR